MSCFSDPLEACLVNSYDLEFNENSEIAYLYYLLDFTQELEVNAWRPKFKELPPREPKLLPSQEKVTKLELKPLPVELKYAFLGPEETFLVVISSKLDSLQEDKLLRVLKEHKGAIG